MVRKKSKDFYKAYYLYLKNPEFSFGIFIFIMYCINLVHSSLSLDWYW